MPSAEDTRRRPAAWERVPRVLSVAAAAVAGVALLTLGVNVVIDVARRTFFDEPVPGTLELTANAWMPLVVVFAMALAVSNREHIRVEMLVDLLSPRARAVAERLTALLVAAVVAALTYFTYEDAKHAHSIREASTGPVAVPIWLIKWLVVGAMVLFTVQAVVAVFEPLRAAGTATDDDEPAPGGVAEAELR